MAVPPALINDQFPDQVDDILRNLVIVFKVFWTKYCLDLDLGHVVFETEDRWDEVSFNMFVHFAKQLISCCESKSKTETYIMFYINSFHHEINKVIMKTPPLHLT